MDYDLAAPFLGSPPPNVLPFRQLDVVKVQVLIPSPVLR